MAMLWLCPQRGGIRLVAHDTYRDTCRAAPRPECLIYNQTSNGTARAGDASHAVEAGAAPTHIAYMLTAARAAISRAATASSASLSFEYNGRSYAVRRCAGGCTPFRMRRRLGADKATISWSAASSAPLFVWYVRYPGPRYRGPSTRCLHSSPLDDVLRPTPPCHGICTVHLSGPLHLNPPHFAFCRRAIDWMDRTVKEEDIACDWQRVPTYVYTPNQQPKNLDYLEQELQVCWVYIFFGCDTVSGSSIMESDDSPDRSPKQTEAATTVPAAPIGYTSS